MSTNSKPTSSSDKTWNPDLDRASQFGVPPKSPSGEPSPRSPHDTPVFVVAPDEPVPMPEQLSLGLIAVGEGTALKRVMPPPGRRLLSAMRARRRA